jgi:hypothetical protein
MNKRRLFLAQRGKNDPILTNHYKSYCKILSCVIKSAKQRHYNSILTRSKNKTKFMWNLIKNNSNINSKGHNINSIKENGKQSRNGHIITDAFSNYFVSAVQSNCLGNAMSNCANSKAYLFKAFTQPFPDLKFKWVSSKEIEDITRSLKTKNSYEYDGISTKILRSSILFISSPLTYISNRMLTTSIFPIRLKFSEIRPIFKRGDKNDTSNYRPISILTSFSKTFEKVLYNRLCRHIRENHILANEQFGFRLASSTTCASYHLISNVLSELNSKSLVGGIFHNLHKAFDSINHDILLSKLEFYGITGTVYNLIKSYLQDRQQRVLVNSDSNKYYPKWEPVTVGVPQG